MELDALYVNLKILGNCQAYNRINTKGSFFELVGPVAQVLPVALQRWYAGENRHDALRKIQELYVTARDILRNDTIQAEESNACGNTWSRACMASTP